VGVERSKEKGKISSTHVVGVDSLRLVCAVWVLLSHVGGVPFEPLLKAVQAPAQIQTVLRAFNGIAFNGVAAVMVFFVISGFCIHFPARGKQNVDPIPFWSRRMLRVGLPLIAATLLARIVTGRSGILEPVLWSLYCELIYYGIYPLLIRMASRVGWISLFWGAAAAALVLASMKDANNGSFWAYGVTLTWLLGLPIWIGGVLIAEKCDLWLTVPSRRQLYSVRVAVWAYSALAVALQFHSGVHYKWTMLLFCPLAMVWFIFEVRNSNNKGAHKALEIGGMASYSLYLCHLIALDAVAELFGRTTAPLLLYVSQILSALALSAGFYLLVERPAHSFARMISRRLQVVAGQLDNRRSQKATR
jgi:peptidoglycan/LPS O-acetylase OafA/YrhL